MSVERAGRDARERRRVLARPQTDAPVVRDTFTMLLHEAAIDALRPRLATGQQILIAAIVYAEILVRPLERGTDHAVDAFIAAIGATIVPIDRVIARRAAKLRGTHRPVRLPAAISLATALVVGAEYVTLDRRLGKVAGVERSAG